MDGGPARRRRRPGWRVVGAAATLLVLAGCSGDDAGTSGGGSTAVQPQPEPADAPGAADGGAPGASDPGKTGSGSSTTVPLGTAALIRTAEMTVAVSDVPAGAAQAQAYARAAEGTVAGDNRSGSGDQARADLILKVRPDRLESVLDQLGRLGTERQRTSSTDDVTEQVADVQSRVATMQASISRVRAILSRATRIGDVVAVEGELSRRITELESLQARQRALASQTSLATITLHLVADRVPLAAVDRSGFLGGLSDGWHAFTRAVAVLLTALGTVLPFLLVLGPILVVLRWWQLRRSRRPAPAAAAPAPGGPAG
jgi:Domain of unknown function (DUF4349)